MMGFILISRGPPKLEIMLNVLPVLIGRNPTAEICLADADVGTFQCIIDKEGDMLNVSDLCGGCGTLVNGVRITKSTLMPGDRLTVGKAEFLVRYDRGCGG
jgi:pSer/pThr/pTyr-binding forkhead associated (FHA) protein